MCLDRLKPVARERAEIRTRVYIPLGRQIRNTDLVNAIVDSDCDD